MIIIENPETVKHIKNLESAIQRVRELHQEYHCSCCPKDEIICLHCDQDYPCDTIKALDGEQ